MTDSPSMTTTAVLLALFLAHRVALIVYNLYFHPLSGFPGPKFAAVSRSPFSLATFEGRLIYYIDAIHRAYGATVRIAPDDLTTIEGQAWTDIYAHRQQLPKHPATLIQPLNGAHSVFSADDANHQRMRRILAHAFSDKSLKEQEPLIQSYIDLMIKKMHEQCSKNPERSIDMEKQCHHVVLDTMGDLVFGKSFQCLETEGDHAWVAQLFTSTKVAFLLACLRKFPPFGRLVTALLLSALVKRRQANSDYISDKLKRRLEANTERPNSMSHIMRHMDEKGMTMDELHTTSIGFILAESESLAGTLSAATLLLLQNPQKLRQLQDEVRGAFSSMQEINLSKVLNLPYLQAVLDESLRLAQPAPSHSPRIVHPGGQHIAGRWMPGGTSIGVPHFAAYHSPLNFEEPKALHPERWLPETHLRYSPNNTAVVQPFSAGPRNCIGKSLAYAMMSLTLSKCVFDFDMETADPYRQGAWLHRRMYPMYENQPLMVKVWRR